MARVHSPVTSNMGIEPHPPCQVSVTQDNPLSPSPSPLDSKILCHQSGHYPSSRLWPWPWIDHFARPPCPSVLQLQPLRAHRAACKGSQSWLKSNSSFSEKNTPTLRILSCYQGFASCSRAVFKTSPWYLHRYMGLFKVLWGSLWKVCIKVLVLLKGLYKRC